jgi:two-component system, NarL family, sensor kinase
MLDEIGFSAAAKWLVDGFSDRSKIAVSLDIPTDLKLPIELELTLFRVLQEGLTNVHRHSGSNRAEVVVAVKSGAIVMTLRDYGKGIPELSCRILKPVERRPESVLAECADVWRIWMERWT